MGMDGQTYTHTYMYITIYLFTDDPYLEVLYNKEWHISDNEDYHMFWEEITPEWVYLSALERTSLCGETIWLSVCLSAYMYDVCMYVCMYDVCMMYVCMYVRTYVCT